MKKLNETFIRIDREIGYTEDWYKGHIEHKEDVYEFWFVHTHGKFCGDDYPYRIDWFRKDVKSEVRCMENEIIEQFENRINGTRT